MKKNYQIITKAFIGALLLVFPLFVLAQNANRIEKPGEKGDKLMLPMVYKRKWWDNTKFL